MTVKTLISAARTKIVLEQTVIWNPNTSKVLFFGPIYNIPKSLLNKEIKAYCYNKKKNQMIIRI